ncbi:hypothetical protein [Paenibacillus sp. HB172176]|uniref:hypothetical protein n=1 Tax=Paenibacillus sp. HB172176 TaxID=2493690 RepID=UPI00143BFD68|nr:hypothetical protein [Paenibacillus sp. HB172176]
MRIKQYVLGCGSISRLQEIYEYKNLVISKILESSEIVKALYYENTDYLDQNDLEDPSVLIYNNVFPHRFIPDNTTTSNIFLTASYKKITMVNNRYIVGNLVLEVFTTSELLRTDYGMTRIDFIMNKINDLLNSQKGVGIGKLEFIELDELVVNDIYSGASITYRPIQFN